MEHHTLPIVACAARLQDVFLTEPLRVDSRFAHWHDAEHFQLI